MGAAAPDRDGGTGERAMGTAAAAKCDWIDRRGSLSRRRAWLPRRNGRDRFPAYADQSAGERAFCDGSSGLRIQISRAAFGTEGLEGQAAGDPPAKRHRNTEEPRP